MNNWIIIAISLLFGILVMPQVITIAKKFGFVDKPNDRKVHQDSMPRLGGLAIYLSFTIGLVLFYFFTDVFEYKKNLFYSLLIGGFIVASLGIVDDKLELSAKKKLLIQIVAALIVTFFNVDIQYVSNPFGGEMISLGWLTIPLTLFWIVGITNAINLIDGLDGLAGGLSGIAALSIAVIAFLAEKPEEGYLALLLCASLIGFLIFNFYPAKIFMGDIGSLFLGFVLAILTVKELKQLTIFGVMVPIMLLAVPILDTLYAILRRKINHTSIFQADKHHLHHKLMAAGYSHRKAVLAIYLISLMFSSLGIIIPYVEPWIAISIFVVMLACFQFVARKIGMIKQNKKENPH